MGRTVVTRRAALLLVVLTGGLGAPPQPPPAAAAMSMHGVAPLTVVPSSLEESPMFVQIALLVAALSPSQAPSTEVCGLVSSYASGPARDYLSVPARCDFTLTIVADDGTTVAAVVPHDARRANFTFALYDFLRQRACVSGTIQTAQGRPFIEVTAASQLRFAGTPPPPFAPATSDPCGDPATPPRLVKEVKPSYTEAAMRARIEGMVTMDAVVGTDGAVAAARVTKSLHTELDAQALNAVRQWQFKPGTRNGQPVAVVVEIEMSFTLKDRR